jgi:WD40 repeat protein
MNSGKCEKGMQSHSGGVNALAIRQDSLLSASDDTTLKTWNISGPPERWHCQRPLGGHKGAFRCLVKSGEKAKAYSGSADKTIRVWNLASGALEQTLRGHKGVVHSIALKGDRIISAAADRTIKQWSLTTSTCHHTVEVCEEQSVQNVLSMITSASKIVCPGS